MEPEVIVQGLWQPTLVMEVCRCRDHPLVHARQMGHGVVMHQRASVRQHYILSCLYFLCFLCCTTDTAIGFQLNGQFYSNGSSLSLSSIGEGENALRCVTDGQCCGSPFRAGEFYFPDTSRVLTQGAGGDFYRNRGDGMIRLNRRNNATSPTGVYRCEIPDSTGSLQQLFITLN